MRRTAAILGRFITYSWGFGWLQNSNTLVHPVGLLGTSGYSAGTKKPAVEEPER